MISVTRENLSSRNYYRYYHDYGDMPNYKQPKPSDIFFTVMLFSDGPHAMLLDSLFITGTQWKPFITKTVMDYLDTNLFVTGNCSNPYMLPVVMKNRFCVTANGIMIFPPGYSEHEHQLEILLTWEMLKPYLRKDLYSKLSVK